MDASPTVKPNQGGRRRFVVSDKVQFLATTCATEGIRVLTSLYMARLLFPADYGLMALVLALPGIIACLGDFGIMKALIQIRDAPERELEDTALTLTLGLNGFYLLVRFGGGIYLAWVMHDRGIVWLGLLTGINTFMLGVYQFQMTVLNRALRFRAESFQNLIFAIATSVTGIGLAKAGFGVFALAFQPLGAQVIANMAMYRHHRLRWPSQFNMPLARRMMGFGGKLTFSQYFANMSDILMGLFLGYRYGKDELGLYVKGLSIKDLIGHNIVAAFDRLLYPLLAAARNDLERMRQLLMRTCAGGVFICWFGWAWFFATANDLIPVMLGGNWGGTIPLLKVFSFDLLTASLVLNATLLTQIIPALRVWAKFSFSQTVLTIAVAVACAPWGIQAVAIGVIALQGVLAVVFFGWAVRYLRIPLSVIARRLVFFMAAAGLSYAVMRFLSGEMPGDWRKLWRLLVESSAGGVVYLAFLLATDRETLGEMRQMLLGR